MGLLYIDFWHNRGRSGGLVILSKVRYTAAKYVMKRQGYIEINVSIRQMAFEALADFFNRLGSGGISYSEDMKNATCCISAYFRTEVANEVRKKLEDFFIELENLDLIDEKPKVTTRFVADEDWAENWKQYYHPIAIGKRLIIKPQWESYSADAQKVVVEIDPGMAFGTGTHQTTALCLEELEKTIQGGERVADIGTGSGILSIAAIKLGAVNVDAVDIDIEAVNTARENAIINKVTDHIRVMQGGPLCLIEESRAPYDIVVMNIIADVIIENAFCLSKLVDKSGFAILSGIIDSREGQTVQALQEVDLKVIERRQKDEWILLKVKGEPF